MVKRKKLNLELKKGALRNYMLRNYGQKHLNPEAQ